MLTLQLWEACDRHQTRLMSMRMDWAKYRRLTWNKAFKRAVRFNYLKYKLTEVLPCP